MKPVVLTRPIVLEDLNDHYARINRDEPYAAERFKRQARHDFELLASMPEMGPRHHMKHPRLQGVRFWPIKGFTNFLIFYFPIENGIEVMRVLHGARELTAALANEPPSRQG